MNSELQAHGTRVVTLDDADDFTTVLDKKQWNQVSKGFHPLVGIIKGATPP